MSKSRRKIDYFTKEVKVVMDKSKNKNFKLEEDSDDSEFIKNDRSTDIGGDEHEIKKSTNDNMFNPFGDLLANFVPIN